MVPEPVFESDVTTAVPSTLKRVVRYMDWNVFDAMIKAGEITVNATNKALIDTFPTVALPANAFLNKLELAENFKIEPKVSGAAGAAGIRFSKVDALKIATPGNGSATAKNTFLAQNSRLVFFVENTQTATDGFFAVYGGDNGLVCTADEYNPDAADSAQMFTFSSAEGALEKHRYYTLFKTDYATTLALVEAATKA